MKEFKGSLLGLAAGDALGTTLEFRPPDTFEPIKDMIGGGPFHLEPGQWTDDTSMALCLAESLIETQRFDPRDQMERYCRWWHEGHLSSNGQCFDIGGTVKKALQDFEATGEPISGSIHPHSAGNGCIMRLAPIPLFYANAPDKAIEMSGKSSKTTHGTLACVDACRYFGGLIAGAVKGASKKDLLSPGYRPNGRPWQEGELVEDIFEIAQGSYKYKEPPEIKGTGYVVKSLEAALWAFCHSVSFEDGCLLAVNLGDDADTTGAVYGQLAGAFYGVDDIPEDWLEKLVLRKGIERFAEKLFDLSSRTAPS
ncbi:MAG: ADP-ribosylglycohydrolase family protein [Deltaproteobacteria bacterium]|nr:ADP-ribosylglycohydrolase family protein [Deltaproteobacteria bacterium]